MVISKWCLYCRADKFVSLLSGYLCLGGDKTSLESSDLPLESLSAGSLALVNSVRESGEDVKVMCRVHAVTDTAELQLMQASSCSTEVQTDFEPMWCFHNTPISVDTRSDEITIKSPVPVEGSTMIDLRNCNEFSVVHLEDMRDPSAQFVMLQTGSASAEPVPAAMADNVGLCLPAGGSRTESESMTGSLVPLPLEIVSAPAMFVGGNCVRWKRELELSANGDGLRQPADVDSGIWDMMQALGGGADDSRRSELCRSSLEQQGNSDAQTDPTAPTPAVIHPSLQGVYKMFQIVDGADNPESSVSDIQALNKSSLSGTGSNVRQSSVGGLEDALEPVAVVDFVVHRVEAETVKLERVDLSDSETATQQLKQETMKQASRSHNKTERSTDKNKLSVNTATRDTNQNRDYSDGSYEDDELPQRSNEGSLANARTGHSDVQTYDSATNTPMVRKKHRDVVRVTSARFGRSLRRRVGSKGRGGLKNPNYQQRKSVSADVSRSSSLLDGEDGHQEMARSSGAFSDPSPEHAGCQYVQTANQSVLFLHQPCTSSPYGWRRHGPVGVESHEWLTDGSSSATSGLMGSGLGLFAEPDLLNFEKFPNWMRDLPESLLHVPLSDICIPGKIFIIIIFF